MRKRLLFLILLPFMVFSLYAQRVVTGKVTDESGQPLPGVNVIVDQTREGTITDTGGKYSITVPGPEATLSFSFVGYETFMAKVGNKSTIDVRLSPSMEQLDEIVVVGYGTMKKKDLTGSVASVSASQLKDIPVTSTAQAITGRLAGVQITTSEGSPDAEVKIRIRGGGSITQDNSPLYIIDGFPADNLSAVSPSDIETIDVLKDASSTAIYGARGANGVVIITTKTGREGKPTISYNTYYGVKQLTKELDVLDAYEYVIAQYERNQGSFQDRRGFEQRYGTWDMIDSLYAGYKGIDWQERVFGRDAPTVYHNLSFEGGSEKTRYNLSLTHNKDVGIMIESGFTRNNVNFRFDHKLTDKLTMNFDVKIANTIITGAGTSDPGSSTTNRLKHSVIFRPTNGLSDFGIAPELAFQDDEYYELSGLTDPVTLAKDEYRHTRRGNYNFNGALTYNIIEGLEFRTELGYRSRQEKRQEFDGLSTPNARKYGDKPIAQIEDRFYDTYRFANTLTYRHDINANSFTILAGQELIIDQEDFITVLSRGFPVGITHDLALGSMGLGEDYQAPKTEINESRLLSFFGRINYQYENKYLASVTFRADGSSKFGPRNRWATFPSFSAGWRVSEEEFMNNISEPSYLKLRASYGLAGNDRIDDMLWRNIYEVETDKAYYLNETPLPFFTPLGDNLPNPALKWETTVSRNVGIDIGFFKNRLMANIDIYQNTGMDLLLNSRVPPETGYSSMMTNIGQTTNKGIEVVLNAALVQRNDFQLTANFNISFNKSRIDDLGEVNSFLQSSEWNTDVGADYLVKVGQPVGIMWGFVTDGFYTVDNFNYDPATGEYTLKEGVADNSSITFAGFGPGALKFKNLADPVDEDGVAVPDGNQVTFDADRTIIGNANPKHIGGFNLSAYYKHFDASIFLNWVYGNDVYNANKIEFTSEYRKYTNMLDVMSMDKRWRTIDENGVVVTEPGALAALNANATIWAPPQGRYLLHSWAIEDGSFLRINNVTIGYSLPEKLLRKTFIKSLRIYATGNNLFTFTKYSGYDPEVNTRTKTFLTPGVDYSAYPRSRMYLAGLNVKF